VKGREIQDETKKSLAATTPNGMIAISMAGAKRLEPLGCCTVRIGDFLPKAPCWRQALWMQTSRSAWDEVIIVGEKPWRRSGQDVGWEMRESQRGVAVEIGI